VRSAVVRFDQKFLACLALIVATAALSGCGGGSGSSSPTAIIAAADKEAGPDPATARRIESICENANEESRQVQAGLAGWLSRSSSAEEGITQGLVAPAILVLEKESRQLKALAPRVESAIFATYVGLFEPVLTLAYQRLASGEAQESEQSHALEDLTAGLTLEQAKLAASLGLKGCETDFFRALGTAQ
jgi:hypothetical protein